MISPTIGRVVLFHSDTHQSDQEYPALISYVWGDRCINLGYFDATGRPGGATSVPLLQDDDPIPAFGCYAEWMSYQKAVAAKS